MYDQTVILTIQHEFETLQRKAHTIVKDKSIPLKDRWDLLSGGTKDLFKTSQYYVNLEKVSPNYKMSIRHQTTSMVEDFGKYVVLDVIDFICYTIPALIVDEDRNHSMDWDLDQFNEEVFGDGKYLGEEDRDIIHQWIEYFLQACTSRVTLDW